MNIEVSRRHFMKLAGAGAAGSAIAAFGFGEAEAQVAAHVRPFKLAKATETRNTCTYCSVACGIIMYSHGRCEEGRAGRDHPHRGRRRSPDQSGHALPEGRGAARLRSSPRRGRNTEVREPGTKEWKRITWDDALDRIARLMKDDRDANFVATNKDGVTVNRWTTHRLPRRVRNDQ